MSINTVTPYQTTALYTKNTAMKTAATGERVFNVPEAVATTPTDSSTVYKELSGKYDVRSATLTFDYGHATNYWKQNAPGYISANIDMYETFANSNGQRDWIAEFGARASKDFKYGNLIGYQTKSKILAVLQKLDTKES